MFRLWIFASTDKCFYCCNWGVYPMCNKIIDAKTFKNLVISFYVLRSQIICILHIDSFNLGLYGSCWFGPVCYRLWLDGYQIICVRSISFAKIQQAFQIKLVNRQPRELRTLIKRTSADMELSYYPKP